MGLRERLTTVTRFLQRAASRGHQLREEDERGEQAAPSAAEQSSQWEARRLDGMTAEDRDGEQGSQQRNRDRQARSSEPRTSADEPTRLGDT